MDAERLRWAIFTSSVLSTVDNPEAHLWRTIGAQLNLLGHEATFFEERGNPALTAMLRQSGARALVEFRERFPNIQYRTLEARTGYDLAEWLTRTLSTVDIAVVQREAPGDLIAVLGEFTRPYLQTFLVDCGRDQHPFGHTGDQAKLAGFTAVLAANESLAEAYGQTVPADRVHDFGPLPEVGSDGDAIRDSADPLNDAALRVINSIMAISLRIRRARGAQILPNGRSDQANHPATHEPD